TWTMRAVSPVRACRSNSIFSPAPSTPSSCRPTPPSPGRRSRPAGPPSGGSLPHIANSPVDRREPGFSASIPAPLVLALTIVGGVLSLNLFSIVQEAAKVELGLSVNQLGFIQGVGAALPLALLSVPIGRLVDRRNRI